MIELLVGLNETIVLVEWSRLKKKTFFTFALSEQTVDLEQDPGPTSPHRLNTVLDETPPLPEAVNNVPGGDAMQWILTVRNWPALVVLGVVFGFLTFEAPKAEPAPASDLKARAVKFVELVASGEVKEAAADFDAKMAEALPDKELSKIWESLVFQNGAFQGTGDVRAEKVKTSDVVYVQCLFKRGSLVTKLVYNSDGKIGGLWFQPDPNPPKREQPKAPAGITEFEITIGSGQWKLPGTLSIPAGDGPFPVVVLVHGSGPHDRNETIGPNQPFRDLAWGLGKQGVAVLRYEKRTKKYGAQMSVDSDAVTVMEETVLDAVAAVKFLVGYGAKIDAKRVFVLGHSLGGTVIPRIAEGAKDAAGFIVMAGAARSFEDMVLDQVRYIYSLRGTLLDEDKKNIATLEEQVRRAHALKAGDSVPSSELPLGMSVRYLTDLHEHSSVEGALKVTQPMLFLQGERDYQVTLEDWALWRKALKGHKNVKFILYPDLNHLFMEGKGKATPDEYGKAGTVDQKVVDDIAAWVKNEPSK